MAEQIEMTDLRKETGEQPTMLSEYAGPGASITPELKIGFWFGIGVILAIKLVNSLDYCIEELMSSSNK